MSREQVFISYQTSNIYFYWLDNIEGYHNLPVLLNPAWLGQGTQLLNVATRHDSPGLVTIRLLWHHLIIVAI